MGTLNPGQSGTATVVLTAGSYFVIDTNTDDMDKAYSIRVPSRPSPRRATPVRRPYTYAFICFISDRAGGPPHFTKGMLQEVKIA